MAFHIGQGLQGRTDLVTLKLTEPVAPSELFAAARMVLRDYGVEIVDQAGILSFVAQADFSGDVPLPHQRPSTARGAGYPPHRIPVRADQGGQCRECAVPCCRACSTTGKLAAYVQLDGRLLLRGAGGVVAQAVDVIDVLDQPLLRGRYGAIIEPASLKVEELAEALRRVLTAEGYGATTNLDAGGGAVVLLPIASINKLVVFAWDQPTLDHVEQWAKLLVDQQRDTVAEGIFSYQCEMRKPSP